MPICECHHIKIPLSTQTPPPIGLPHFENLSLSLMDQQSKQDSNGYNNNTTKGTTAPSVFDGTTRSKGYNLRPSSSTTSSPNMQLARHILRATAMILTFIAAIVMGTGKDTARVSIIIDPTSMKTTTFVETIKAKYSSALVYFIVINVLMFLYSASSLAVSFLNKANARNLELAFSISDVLFLILLFSSNGAAITTSITIEQGNVNMGWVKICGAVGGFCAHVTASIVLSMLASSAHLIIVLLQMISAYYTD